MREAWGCPFRSSARATRERSCINSSRPSVRRGIQSTSPLRRPATPGMLGDCLRALAADDDIDIILAHAFFLEDSGMKLAKELVEIYEATDARRS